MRRKGVQRLSVASVFVFPWLALALLSSPTDVKVTFLATGPGGLKIEGSAPELKVHDDGQVVRFVVPLAGVETGIDLRNKHLRENYLHVDKYPTAELEVPWAKLKKPQGAPASGDVEGTLLLHGQKQPVMVKYTASPRGTGLSLSGDFRIDIRKFGIEQPSYMGLKVKPEVDVSVKATTQGQGPQS